MRLTVIPLLAAILTLSLSACRNGREPASDWEKALTELDHNLAREASISQMHRAHLADLKIQYRFTTDPLDRYRLCDRIFDGYLKYDVDSALR